MEKHNPVLQEENKQLGLGVQHYTLIFKRNNHNTVARDTALYTKYVALGRITLH